MTSLFRHKVEGILFLATVVKLRQKFEVNGIYFWVFIAFGGSNTGRIDEQPWPTQFTRLEVSELTTYHVFLQLQAIVCN